MLKSDGGRGGDTPEEDLGRNPSLLTTHGDNVIVMRKVLGSKNTMETYLMDRGWKGRFLRQLPTVTQWHQCHNTIVLFPLECKFR